MESTKETTEIALFKKGVQEESHRNNMEAAKVELATAKEMKTAKESVIQSWLDSKPLIDEIEIQKSNLAKSQQSSKASGTVIEKLESELDTILKSIKSKREDQLRTEMMIHEVNRALDQTRNELERLKLDQMKEKQTQRKLRQTLRLRRQTVQKLQLTLQAILLEVDAVQESTAKALEQIDHSQICKAEGQLTHEDYYALTKRAREKFSKADWRVSVSMEQKLAAEGSHELALSRLNRYYSNRLWSSNTKNITGQLYTEKDVNKQDAIEGEVTTKRGNKSNPKPLTKSEGRKLQQPRRSGGNLKITKKKLNILYKLKKCLLQMIKKLSG
ncbi:hypothetical protein RIF29_33961 [Crotalaria pallida]|uniref:Uncharacterized protein n=1 Tax=Crotalaria pallida TaxID=3830 RepID=A0AAN9HT99_CROPI